MLYMIICVIYLKKYIQMKNKHRNKQATIILLTIYNIMVETTANKALYHLLWVWGFSCERVLKKKHVKKYQLHML